MLARLRQGVRLVVRGRGPDEDARKEVELHLQMEIEDRVARGMTPDEARRTALRDFGGVDRVREEVRDVRGISFWDGLLQDIRYGFRTLQRAPGFTLTAIATLGLGIGANTAMFSVINAVLLHPLPYHDSGRLVRINQAQPSAGVASLGVSIPEVLDYRHQLTTIQDVVEYHQMNFVLLDKDGADRVQTGVVSSGYFDTFGVKPLLGRTFRESDDVLGADPVLVLSHNYWLRKFGGDDRVIGRQVQMNDKAHTIIGVLPPIPGYPSDNDVYMPTSACPFRAKAETTMAGNRLAFLGLTVFGRMKPGVTFAQANAEVQNVAARFAQRDPKDYQVATTGFRAEAISLESETVQDVRPVVLILLGTTALVLVIACANVANLSLSRTLRRSRELALRTALGAGRARIVRQLLTESTMVALAGGLVGLLLASATRSTLAAFAGLFTPRLVDAPIDGWVLGFAVAVSVVTGIGSGTLPALTSRPSLLAALRDGSAQTGDGAGSARVRAALVVAQVAVGFSLVVAAGLLLNSLHRLSTANLGYKQLDRVLAADLHGNWSHQQTVQDFTAFYAALLARAAQIPGVQTVAVTNAVPLSNISPGAQPLSIEGQADPDPARWPRVDGNIASESYFAALGVPLLGGREFRPADDAKAPYVAIINQTMAKLWNGRDPIGTRFSIGQVGGPYTVVGIVGDIREYTVDHPPLPEFYLPFRQSPTTNFTGQVLLKTDGDPLQLVAPLRAAVRAVDSTVPVDQIRTLESWRQDRLRQPRLGAALVAIFAGLALLITLGGVAAVIATSVTHRTREFGIRMALGASRSSVLGVVLHQGIWMVGAGLVLGIGGALALGRVLAQYLYETAPSDPMVYAAVAGLFVVAGVLACAGPAHRATTIDPLKALRAE